MTGNCETFRLNAVLKQFVPYGVAHYDVMQNTLSSDNVTLIAQINVVVKLDTPPLICLMPYMIAFYTIRFFLLQWRSEIWTSLNFGLTKRG